MNSILLEPLENLHRLTIQLFQSLGPPSTKPPPPPTAADLLQADLALASALHVARAHQRRQRRIEELVAEIGVLDESLRDVFKALGDGKRELEDILDDADERLATIDRAKEAAIPLPELLAYAQTLSAFTSAPPGTGANAAPGPSMPAIFPPFPNEEKMRRGRLNAEPPLGMLGETHAVGQAPSTGVDSKSQSVLPPPTVNGGHPHQMHLRNGFGHDDRHGQTQPSDILLDLDLNPDMD
ncbi:vitamin-D-receptor interacting mediator subunit 4-domain-containing protein, partial [Auriculariales sp. MPI-PUGE-AT-0066]